MPRNTLVPCALDEHTIVGCMCCSVRSATCAFNDSKHSIVQSSYILGPVVELASVRFHVFHRQEPSPSN